MSVDPTLDAAAAARRVWDAVVVGAGPAGAMAARELARRGAGVLLVDKARFPRYKVCGGCLNPRALRVLGRAGLGHLVEKLRAVPLTRFKLGAGGAAADVPLPPGAGLSREALDTALVREATLAGAAFLPGVSAALLPVGGLTDRRRLRLRQAGREQVVEGRVVLAANGLTGGLEEHAPAEADHDRPWEPGSRVGAGVMIPECARGYEPGTIYMACGEEGYVGQTAVEDGRVDMAAASTRRRSSGPAGPGSWRSKSLHGRDFLAILGWLTSPGKEPHT